MQNNVAPLTQTALATSLPMNRYVTVKWWNRLLLLTFVALVCLTVVGRSIPSETTVAKYGPHAKKLFREWQVLLNSETNTSDAEKIKAVNLFFNQKIDYEVDRVVWRQDDYWPTPLETFSKGAGDCKSFTINKYVSLRLLGVAPAKMRLIYVKARIGGPSSSLTQAHMVLAYYSDPAAEPLILDSLINSIDPASQRPDLIPVFSFNMESIWVGNVQNNDVNRLTKWRQLLEKLKVEGFSF